MISSNIALPVLFVDILIVLTEEENKNFNVFPFSLDLYVVVNGILFSQKKMFESTDKEKIF